MINGLFQIKNVRRYTGYSIYVLLSILPAHLFCQTKLPTTKENIINAAPTQPTLALVDYNAMQYPHNFFDTASNASILEFINRTPDSELRLMQDIAEAAMRDYIAQNRTSETDADGDGHRSIESGGDDCDDFDPGRAPGRAEICHGFYLAQYMGEKYLFLYRLHDEDCDPESIDQDKTGYDGDMDGDGQTFCKCVNETNSSSESEYWTTSAGHVHKLSPSKTHPGKFVFSGIDCDDNDPVIGRGVQTCVGQDSVRVCENGEWITRKCTKCVEQPNGTGVVIRW